MRLLGLPCARAPRLSSLFGVNHFNVGLGLLRVVCLLSSTYCGGVLSWDPPQRAGPNGDAALRRMFQARPPTGPLRAPLCCCSYRCVLSVGAHHFTAPIAVGAGLARSIAAVAAASLLAELLHGFPRGLVLYFSGVAISAAAAVRGDVVCSQLSALSSVHAGAAAQPRSTRPRAATASGRPRRRLRGRKQATAATWL